MNGSKPGSGLKAAPGRATAEGTAVRARSVAHRRLARVPWKNGGGTTAEIAADPPGASFDTFGWRLSTADVAADGPFSHFPGVDRTLVLIEGAGLELDIGGSTHGLDEASPLLCFPGEADTFARLSAGPVRDLNVMTRRGLWSHAVDIVPAGAVLRPDRPAVVLAAVALSGPAQVAVDGRVHELHRLDTLLIEGAPARIAADRPIALVRLWPSPDHA